MEKIKKQRGKVNREREAKGERISSTTRMQAASISGFIRRVSFVFRPSIHAACDLERR